MELGPGVWERSRLSKSVEEEIKGIKEPSRIRTTGSWLNATTSGYNKGMKT